MAKTLKNISSIIFYLVVLALSFLIGFALLFPMQFANAANYHGYVVVSDSMTPTIPVMSLIIVEKVEPKNLMLGDIITFETNIDNNDEKEIVTHRLVEKRIHDDERIYRTKAETTDLWDRWEITDANIYGRVVATIPYLGYVVVFLNKFAIPMLLTLNIFVWLAMLKIFKNWNNEKKT